MPFLLDKTKLEGLYLVRENKYSDCIVRKGEIYGPKQDAGA
jgi:hypothetical protein